MSQKIASIFTSLMLTITSAFFIVGQINFFDVIYVLLLLCVFSFTWLFIELRD
jgi:hypothetical protein